MKYLWIIGGGLLQVPVIQEAQRMGYQTIVSDGNPRCVCAPLADVFVNVDIFDIDTHTRLAKDAVDVAGVIACGIDANVTASWVAKTLGLLAADPEVARICHNKHEFRKATRFLGYPTPIFYSVSSFEDFKKQFNQYPPHIIREYIIKNSDNSGSRGTSFVTNRDYCGRFKKSIENAIQASKSGLALIEERYFGTEHTVETCIQNNTFHPCFITDRLFDYSSGYPIEKGLRHPSTLPQYVQRKAYQLAQDLALDLGVTNSPFKLDIMVTDDGIRIMEATTRWSGGFDCQYLVPYATGKNIIRVAIQLATGQTIDTDLLEDKLGLVGVTGSMFPPTGKITKIDDSEARKVDGVKEIFWRYKDGDTIEPYIDCAKRVNFIICVGDTEEKAYQSLDEAKSKIVLEVE